MNQNEQLLELAGRAKNTPAFKLEVFKWMEKHGEWQRFQALLESTRQKPGYKYPSDRGGSRMELVYADSLRMWYGMLETDGTSLPDVPEREQPGKAGPGASRDLARLIEYVDGRDDSKTRTPALAEEIRWVGENVEKNWEQIATDAIPSMFAVSMLAYAKNNRPKFWESIASKLIPSKISSEGTPFADDGRTPTDLVRQIKEYAENISLEEIERVCA